MNLEFVIRLISDNPMYSYDDFVFILHGWSSLSWAECESLVDNALFMIG